MVATAALILGDETAAPSAFQGAELVLRVGSLVDPDSRTVSRNQTVVMKDGLISSIAPSRGTTQVGEIDLTSYSVMPGLIDAHTHLCIRIRPERDQGEYLVLNLYDPAPFRALQGAFHAREMLLAGFTTVRDLGNAASFADLDLKRAVKAGLVEGPDILASGRIIAPFGGQHYLGDLRSTARLEEDPEYAIADSRDEMRRAIRENVWRGADVIKIIVDAHPYRYTEDDIAFIVEEAGRAGRKVAAHAQTAEGARAAARARVASIEHGWNLPPDVLDTMVKHQVALVSTDFTVEALEGFGWTTENARAIHQRRINRLRSAAASGVPLVFGSDLMVSVKDRSRGAAAARYVHSYVEAGVEPWTILRAFTAEAARLLGVERDRGKLQIGMRADLIAIAGDPLANPQLLGDVRMTIKNGKIASPLR